MSTFTRFSNVHDIEFDPIASRILKKKYWRIKTGYRYFVGCYGSDTWVDVPEGKLTDGATVPWPFNKLIPTWGEYSQAVTLHDHLCDTYLVTRFVNGELIDVKVTREEIDEIFNEAMMVLKVKTWRRVAIMLGVDLYRYWMRPTGPKINKKKEELEASYIPA